ncbi:hypothetical protein AB5J72_46160 [Streptomyces sp. CG1]|uniref:hypothetical protein n=1 Tax=Streptomyces sp. CG1 TaxID=1287523 RepID=UPI0034E27BCF
MGTDLAFVVVFGALGDQRSRRRTVAWLGGVPSAAGCLAVYCLLVAIGHNFLPAAVAAGAFGAGMAEYVPLSPLLTAQAPERQGQVVRLQPGAGRAWHRGRSSAPCSSNRSAPRACHGYTPDRT